MKKRIVLLAFFGLLGQVFGVVGVGIVAFSMIAELFLHRPLDYDIWIGGSMIVVAMVILEILIRENKRDQELCQCPCGCRTKRDGLEDLCRYCLEYHEDLRREVIGAETKYL